MKYCRTILICYIVGILLFLISDVIQLKDNAVFLSEIIFIFGLVSVVGLVLAVLPFMRNFWIKLLAVGGECAVYYYHIRMVSMNKIAEIFLLFYLIILASMFYSSFDNVKFLWEEEKGIKKLLQVLKDENIKYEETIQKANELQSKWEKLDDLLDVERPLSEVIKRAVFTKKFQPNIDLECKYPIIDYGNYIGYYSLITSRQEIQKDAQKIKDYYEWLIKTEEKIRIRNERIEQWMDKTQDRINEIIFSSHMELPKWLRDASEFCEDAKVIKEKYNKK